jgi:uncharacterized protein YdaU (DUF1376 family)
MVGWYKRDPSAALEGMHHLTLEERGAYNTVLDLIYLRDDHLPDDDRFISGYLGVDKRVWTRLKTSLVANGKLLLEDGFIRNPRATTEVRTVVRTRVANTVAGQISGVIRAEKSAAKSNDNNKLNGTGVGTDVERPFEPYKSKSKSKKEEKPPTPFALPPWVPSDAWDGWIEARKKKNSAPTERAMMLAVREMEKLRKQGHDPGLLLDHATLNNWKGIYPGRNGETLAKGKGGQQSFGI